MTTLLLAAICLGMVFGAEETVREQSVWGLDLNAPAQSASDGQAATKGVVGEGRNLRFSQVLA